MCSAKKAARKAAAQAQKDAQVAMEKQEASFKEMLAMVPETPKPQDYTPAPMSTRSTLDDANSGVRTSKSKRKSTLNMNKGLSSLRIPLNTSQSGGGSGLNIG